MFQKENRFLVLKWDDIKKFLHPNDEEALDRILTIISEGRKAEGKKDNSYVVVNEDEPYAAEIWALIERQEAINRIWNKIQSDPELKEFWENWVRFS